MYLEDMKETILIISDTQAPAHHPDTLEFLKYAKKKLKPTRVVQIGDLVDFNCFTSFVRDPNCPNALDELDASRAFIKDLAKIFPKLDYVLGNHEMRIFKRLQESGLPEECLKSLQEILGTPAGWDMHFAPIEIDGILFHHGDGVPRAPKSALTRTMQSNVYGHHTQDAGVHFHPTHKELFFSMLVGCLVDKKHVYMSYAKKYITHPFLGIGVVEKGVPRLLPMKLNKKGSWTGVL